MLDRTIAWRHYGCTYSVANYSIQTYIELNIYEINKYFFVVINIPKLRPNYTLCNMDVNPSSQNINLKLKLSGSTWCTELKSKADIEKRPPTFSR